MRRPIQVLHTIILFMACALLILSIFSVSAQDNLLNNPGFESPYTEDSEGSPPRTVADGWTPWHIPRESNQPSYENVQPEYDETAPDTTRIREGDNAQNIFTSFFTFDGGVFQRVSDGITPGTEYRFSVYGYVWSSTLGNPEQSEIPGGVLVQAGIDPTGGTDATSDDIEWSSPAAFGQYDSYRQYAVRAAASGNAITVFVRISVDDAVPDTSVWLDEAVLEISADGGEVTETPAPAATATDEPQPTDIVIVATATSEPIATETPEPQPTETPQPVATNTVPAIDPTATIEDPATTTPEPTATALVVATSKVAPTFTPVPTETLVPPTFTPAPTFTLVPPTFTPLPPPTATSPPTFTPQPGDPTPTQEVESPSTFTPVPTLTPFVPTDVPLPTATATIDTLLSDFPARVPHTIRRGENVQQIAQLYGSTVDAIIAANGLNSDAFIREGDILSVPVAVPAVGTVIPNITLPPPTATHTLIPTIQPAGNGGAAATYIVQGGDTLFSIAARFNTTVAAIAQRNGIVNPNLITVGQFLIIPGTSAINPPPQPTGPTTYIVLPGDNLYRISLRFGVSMLQIAQANGIFNVNRIFAGQVLIIP